mmetsp:Transcript_25747/g.60189  ORF Transcript_25747/g.60189 Transcript_25747/m.60189 type:complete len:87 (-) Transcript_25747:871-1131(-)
MRDINGKDEVPGKIFLVNMPPSVTRHDDKQRDVPIVDNVMPLMPSDDESSTLSGSIIVNSPPSSSAPPAFSLLSSPVLAKKKRMLK